MVNAIGQKIGKYSKEVNGGNIKINTSTLPSGVYFMTIEFNSEIVTKKFIKK